MWISLTAYIRNHAAFFFPGISPGPVEKHGLGIRCFSGEQNCEGQRYSMQKRKRKEKKKEGLSFLFLKLRTTCPTGEI